SSLILSFFFFQAEDGIRDFHVTGVQTCALPISRSGRQYARGHQYAFMASIRVHGIDTRVGYRYICGVLIHVWGVGKQVWLERRRSEERRVGKEWRSGGRPERENKRGFWIGEKDR